MSLRRLIRGAARVVCVPLAGAMALAAGGAVRAQPASRPPNVILFFADDMGYADLGVFGARGYRTPNLDRLAVEGRRFTNFHVSQPVCSASRASLLTGCYANRIGIHGALGPSSRTGIHADETTLAEVFKSRGYATGMVGKWHLGHHPRFLPTRHGFDEYLGLPYSNDMWPHHPQNPTAYPALPLLDGERVIDSEVTPEDQNTLTERYTARAVDFVKRSAKSPYFMYIAYSMPHVPLFVSEPFRGRTGAGLYADVVTEIDASVGRVMDAVKATGNDENTLVIFTSDNGPWLSYGNHAGSAGYLREGKGTVWEGGVRVPCLMRWPGKIPARSRSDSFLMTIDLLPTLAARIGAAAPPLPIDGKDVWPEINGTARSGRPDSRPAYLFYYETNQLQALVSGDGRWKLHLPHSYRSLQGRPGGSDGRPANYSQLKIERPELYDLETDPGELRDIAAARPEVVERLLGEAEKARAELGDSLTGRRGSASRPPGQLDGS